MKPWQNNYFSDESEIYDGIRVELQTVFLNVDDVDVEDVADDNLHALGLLLVHFYPDYANCAQLVAVPK